MRRKLLKKRPFLEDYREAILWLLDHDPQAADAFCNAVEETLDFVRDHPLVSPGARLQRFPHIRKCQVRGFRVWLLFYETRTEEVVIWRLSRGSRDWQSLFLEALE